jgi:hypothetical protein
MKTLLVCCMLAVPVLAGKRILSEGSDGKVTRRTELLLDGVRMRSSTDGFAMLVRPDADGYEFLMIDTAKRQYYAMDRKFFLDMVTAFEGIQEQTDKLLASMPVEMREQLAKNLKMAQPVLTYAPSGTDRVNGIPCLVFDQFSGNEKTSEICVAKPGDVGVSAAEFRIVEQAGDFQFKMLEGLGDNPIANSLMDAESALMMNPELRGIPMRTTTLFKGAVMYSDKFVSIEDAVFTDADFSVGDAVRVDPPSFKIPAASRPEYCGVAIRSIELGYETHTYCAARDCGTGVRWEADYRRVRRFGDQQNYASGDFARCGPVEDRQRR